MGCDLSTASHGRHSDAPGMHSLNTRLAKSIDQIVPAADNAKSPRPGQPIGWGVFNEERDRRAFIRAACLVLSDNGTFDVDNLIAEIFYSRCGRGYAAQIAVMDDTVVKHAIVGHRYGESQRHAFGWLKHEIERQLAIILQRNHKVVSKDDWDEPLARKVRPAPSRQSIQPKPSIQSIQPKPSHQSISQQKQPSRRSSRQAILPFEARPDATTEEQNLTDRISQLPPDKRLSLIATCASPTDLNALLNIPECSAIAAKRRSAAGLLPPIGSPAWEETRTSGARPGHHRNDSKSPRTIPTKNLYTHELNSDGSAARKAPGTGSLGMGSTSFALTTLNREAQGPLIASSGRFGTSAVLGTNDSIFWDSERKEYKQHASVEYAMQYSRRQEVAKMEHAGRPAGPGVMMQRQWEQKSAMKARSSGRGSGASGSGGRGGGISPDWVPDWFGPRRP